MSRFKHPLTSVWQIAFIAVCLTIKCAQPALAQREATTPQFSEAIEDNSYYIEEAYNQEERVVQHISSAVYFQQPAKMVGYSFTQEWPVWGQTHQLSYTVPYTPYAPASSTGFGDILLNYRLQIWTKENFAAFAPRLSIILPTGDVSNGLGMGTVGAQINLPFSKRLSDPFIVHVNAGTTFLPVAKTYTSTGKVNNSLTWFNTGASVIWLATPTFNFMLESVQNFTSATEDDGSVSHSTEVIVSPGIRYAINLGTLQIVPGIAVPFDFMQGTSRTGMLFYLSFEHPY